MEPVEPQPPVFPTPTKWFTGRRLRVLCWIALAVLALIVFWQNWGEVETPILFMTVRMPRSLFIVSMLGIGFLLGLLTPSPWRNKGSK